MGQLQRALRLRDGTALALGSIAGSGILFLPSLTYAIAGPDALVSWLGAMALCVPVLFMLTDMVRAVPDGSGLAGFVARGLGPHAAASVPLLLLALFFLGMPAGVLVAGDYLAHAVGGGQTRLLGALAILGGAVATNLLGVRSGARVQTVVTWGLLAVGLLLIGLTFPQAVRHYDAVRPELASAWPALSGVVVAFWAFAGFENLTFIAGEFRNPRRDFFLAVTFAFAAYGALAVALTANIAGVVPRAEVSQLERRAPAGPDHLAAVARHAGGHRLRGGAHAAQCHQLGVGDVAPDLYGGQGGPPAGLLRPARRPGRAAPGDLGPRGGAARRHVRLRQPPAPPGRGPDHRQLGVRRPLAPVPHLLRAQRDVRRQADGGGRPAGVPRGHARRRRAAGPLPRRRARAERRSFPAPRPPARHLARQVVLTPS